jgi:hypothetical protein
MPVTTGEIDEKNAKIQGHIDAAGLSHHEGRRAFENWQKDWHNEK